MRTNTLCAASSVVLQINYILDKADFHKVSEECQDISALLWGHKWLILSLLIELWCITFLHLLCIWLILDNKMLQYGIYVYRMYAKSNSVYLMNKM